MREPRGAGLLAGASGQSADLAFDREPCVALSFRPWPGGDAQRLRQDGWQALASGVAGLAGHLVPRRRARVPETAPPAHRHEHDLSTILDVGGASVPASPLFFGTGLAGSLPP